MEPHPILRDVFLVALGSVSAILGSIISAFLQRSTASSSKVFERSLDALKDLWAAVVQAQLEFTPRVGMGHKKWVVAEKLESALAALR